MGSDGPIASFRPATSVGRHTWISGDNMRSLTRTLIGIFALALPGTLAAQKLTPGTWTGTIAPPDQGPLDAAFDVRVVGDTTKLTMKADGRVVEVSDLKVEPGKLLFSFAPGGNVIRCTLLLKD